MSDPSTEYKQYILANLPSDITVDPVTGFFLHNGHAFPTYLQAKWYRDYINKYQRQNYTIIKTNTQSTLFTRDGIDYLELVFTQSGNFTLEGLPTTCRYAFAAGGSAGGRRGLGSSFVPGGGGAGGLVQSQSFTNFTQGTYSLSVGLGSPENSVDGAGLNGENSQLTTPETQITAFGGGFGATAGTGQSVGSKGGSGGGGRGSTLTAGGGTAGEGVVGQGFPGGNGFATDTEAERASGGGGGAGGPGGNGSLGTPGLGGSGQLLDWISTPRIVCRGGNGILRGDNTSSSGEVWGNGSGASSVTSGKGGNGFGIFVFPANKVLVRSVSN